MQRTERQTLRRAISIWSICWCFAQLARTRVASSDAGAPTTPSPDGRGLTVGLMAEGEGGGIGGEKGVNVAIEVRFAMVDAQIRRRVPFYAAHNCRIDTFTFNARRRLGLSAAVNNMATSSSGKIDSESLPDIQLRKNLTKR